jgi:hypothetical protein
VLFGTALVHPVLPDIYLESSRNTLGLLVLSDEEGYLTQSSTLGATEPANFKGDDLLKPLLERVGV